MTAAASLLCEAPLEADAALGTAGIVLRLLLLLLLLLCAAWLACPDGRLPVVPAVAAVPSTSRAWNASSICRNCRRAANSCMSTRAAVCLLPAAHWCSCMGSGPLAAAAAAATCACSSTCPFHFGTAVTCNFPCPCSCSWPFRLAAAASGAQLGGCPVAVCLVPWPRLHLALPRTVLSNPAALAAAQPNRLLAAAIAGGHHNWL